MNKFKLLLVGLLTVILGSTIAVGGAVSNSYTEAYAASTKTFYFKPGVWNVDGAIFWGHFWGGASDDDVRFLDDNGDGFYEAEVKVGHTDVIFTRCGSTSTGNWDKEWNRQQTKLETGKNCYTITDWGSGTWSTYTPPAPPATPFANGTKLYAKVDDKYLNSGAIIKAKFSNGSTENTVETTNIYGNYFSFFVPGDDLTQVSIQRISPSNSSVWNTSGSASFEEGKNLLIMAEIGENVGWDKVSLSWSTSTYSSNTVTYKNPSDNSTLGTSEIPSGETWNSAFFEKGGYRLEGWYEDQHLTKKYAKGDKPTKDLTLYANYVAAEDYTILIPRNYFGVSESKNPVMNIYMYRDALDGGNNTWPGNALTECTMIDHYYLFIVDASKSYDKLILNVNFDGRDNEQYKDQFETVNTTLSTEEYKVYQVGDASGTDKRSCSPSYNEYSLAALVYELGGAWGENTETRTPNCAANYEAAKAMFLDLSAEAQEAFETATEAGLVQARDRYVNWCAANGDLTPFEATSSGFRNNLISVFNNDKNYLITTIIVLISVTAIAILIIKKRKSAEQ